MVNVPMLRGSTSRSLLRCFPKRHGAEPVPNELSMLIFYLQTRPGKIPKVVQMLAQRAAAAARHNQTNDAVVCALVMRDIVAQLTAHVSLFAKGAVDVLNALLASRGEPVFAQAALLFAEYNRVHRGVLFSGYPGFAQHFLDVVKQFAAAARTPPRQIAALDALASLGHSPAASTVCGRQALGLALEGILVNFANADDQIASAAMRALCEYVNTPSLAQTSAVVDKLIVFVGPKDDSALLLKLQAVVPKPNRFSLCVSLVQALPASGEPELLARAAMLNTLLQNPDSKVGLSAIDVLRALLKVQHMHLPSDAVLVALRRCIGSLAATAIYPGQSGDLTSEILLSLKRNPNNAPSNACDLLNIITVMDSSEPRDRKLPAAAWLDTFVLTARPEPIASLYARAFVQFMGQGKPGHSMSVQRGVSVGKGLCNVLQNDDAFEAQNYCAAYSCLVALADAMGPDCVALLPVLVDTLGCSDRARTVVVAVCKHVFHLSNLNENLVHVDWPRFSAAHELVVEMPPETKQVPQVADWGIDLDFSTVGDASDVSDMARDSIYMPRPVRKMTGLAPPTVQELVRRQTDTFSQRSVRSARSAHSSQSQHSSPSASASAPSSLSPESRRVLLNLVQDVSIGSGSKGSLTVH